MIVTFDEVWKFIETTFVSENIIELLDPHTGIRIPSDTYIQNRYWEKRYDIDILRKLWDEHYTFIVHGSCVTPEIREIIEEIEADNNVDAQSHIYMGKLGSRSFSVHADKPDNFILQCIGKSRVTVYNEYSDVAGVFPDANVSIKEQFILEPGNSVYIPSLQFHLFEPLTDRLSISVPMIRK
jgi:hypothetical protein